LAPGASLVKFMMSVTRESMCPVMRMTRLVSLVPRWMATTSITSVGCGMRAPVKVCEGVTISRASVAGLGDRRETRLHPAPCGTDAMGVRLRVGQRMAGAEAHQLLDGRAQLLWADGIEDGTQFGLIRRRRVACAATTTQASAATRMDRRNDISYSSSVGDARS